jgi:uncharacterized protein YegL
MEQDTLFTLNQNKNKGFAALLVVMIAAILAILAFLVIQFGKVSNAVSLKKQLLDACSVSAGRSIIETNDIDNICSESFLNRCASLISSNIEPDFQCEELGLVCNSQGECKREFKISSTYSANEGQSFTTKSTKISVAEETHEVEIINAAVIMLLDYSGSMQGNRINQLKNTVNSFISSDFNLSYSVILYNNEILSEVEIGKGPGHKNNVSNVVNSNTPSGGTNFVVPLHRAMTQIQSTNYDAYYILLISDGSPNEGAGPSTEFVNNTIMNISDDACIYTTEGDPCVSVYTIGVDNANTDVLESLSGNTLGRNPNDFSYIVNANQVSEAFNAIIEEIMCRVGPVSNQEKLYVFNGTNALEKDIDYIHNEQHHILKFYDSEPFNVCTNMLNNNAEITLRWGKAKLSIEQ